MAFLKIATRIWYLELSSQKAFSSPGAAASNPSPLNADNDGMKKYNCGHFVFSFWFWDILICCDF